MYLGELPLSRLILSVACRRTLRRFWNKNAMCGFYSTAVLKGKIVLPTMVTSFSLPCYTQARNLLSRTERCLCAAVGGSALIGWEGSFFVF